MINSKRSIFKKTTNKYKKDSIFEIIDIEEAIKKSKNIGKCPLDKFLYCKDLGKTEKKISIMSYSLNDLNFESDKGRFTKFTDVFQIIDFIGNGTFGMVLSAYDKLNKYQKVAIKVFTNDN